MIKIYQIIVIQSLNVSKSIFGVTVLCKKLVDNEMIRFFQIWTKISILRMIHTGITFLVIPSDKKIYLNEYGIKYIT